MLHTYPYRVEKNCIWRVIDKEIVILSDNAKSFHTLNDVGGEIWKLADGTNSINYIISRITKEFEIDTETATKGVMEFINQLHNMNLLILENKSKKDE